jgi:hypothetical protein
MAFSIAPIAPLSYGLMISCAGLGHLEPRQLLERHLGAVVVDHQLLDQRRGRPAGAHAGELDTGVLDRLGHLLGGIVEHHGGGRRSRVGRVLSAGRARTPAPCRRAHPRAIGRACRPGRPSRMDRTLPGWSRSNITMGSLLSMHSVMAVESMALRPG